MNDSIIIGGLILALGVIFYLGMRKSSRQLGNINTAVRDEAKLKGIHIESMISPAFKEWKNSPFDKGIKTGKLGFEGLPYNREFYRVITFQDPSSAQQKRVWIRVTRNHKTGKLTLEWKEQPGVVA